MRVILVLFLIFNVGYSKILPKYFHPLKFNFQFETKYDDNIFRFSPFNKEVFTHGGKLALSDLKSLDDFVFKARFEFNYRLELFGKENKFFWRTLCYRYQKNQIKNYNSHLFYIKHYLNRRNYIQAMWSRIPLYYLRPYWDRDHIKENFNSQSQFHCDYSENILMLKATYYLLPYNFYQIYIQKIQWYYNQRFTEFDTDGIKVGARMYYIFSGNIKTGIELSLCNGNNIGHISGTNRPDLSYFENAIKLSVDFGNFNFRTYDFNLNIAYKLRHRIYTTELSVEEDILHSGHESLRQELQGEIDFPLSDKISLNFFGSDDWRLVINGSELSKKYKEFNNMRMGFGFKYKFK